MDINHFEHFFYFFQIVSYVLSSRVLEKEYIPDFHKKSLTGSQVETADIS
jgi:hypothetical protein